MRNEGEKYKGIIRHDSPARLFYEIYAGKKYGQLAKLAKHIFWGGSKRGEKNRETQGENVLATEKKEEKKSIFLF